MPEQGQQQPTLTAEDVRIIVSEALELRADSDALLLSDVNNRFDALDSAVSSMAETVETIDGRSEGVMEVRATSSQVDTAKGALRVLCTEGLVLIVVLSINAGLLGWQAFRGRFVSNG